MGLLATCGLRFCASASSMLCPMPVFRVVWEAVVEAVDEMAAVELARERLAAEEGVFEISVELEEELGRPPA